MKITLGQKGRKEISFSNISKCEMHLPHGKHTQRRGLPKTEKYLLLQAQRDKS